MDEDLDEAYKTIMQNEEFNECAKEIADWLEIAMEQPWWKKSEGACLLPPRKEKC